MRVLSTSNTSLRTHTCTNIKMGFWKRFVSWSLYLYEYLSVGIQARAELERVDIVFHQGVDTKSENLRRNIVEKSYCDVKDVKSLSNKARLTIQGLYLNAVAPIDGVCHIEDVNKVVECNDIACQILKFDS